MAEKQETNELFNRIASSKGLRNPEALVDLRYFVWITVSRPVDCFPKLLREQLCV